jgi:hypothetical protein
MMLSLPIAVAVRVRQYKITKLVRLRNIGLYEWFVTLQTIGL